MRLPFLSNHQKSRLRCARAGVLGMFLRTVARPLPSTPARILVVAPHPDDESFGCAGLITRCREAGGVVQVICLTDGEQALSQTTISRDAVAQARRRQLRETMRMLDVPLDNLTFLGLPDSRLSVLPPGQYMETVTRLTECMTAMDPQWIHVTHPLDGWPDHTAAAELAAAALKQEGGNRTLAFYGVWMWHNLPAHRFPTLLKNRVRRVASTQTKKKQVLRAYLDARDPELNLPYCGKLPSEIVRAAQAKFEYHFFPHAQAAPLTPQRLRPSLPCADDAKLSVDPVTCCRATPPHPDNPVD